MPTYDRAGSCLYRGSDGSNAAPGVLTSHFRYLTRIVASYTSMETRVGTGSTHASFRWRPRGLLSRRSPRRRSFVLGRNLVTISRKLDRSSWRTGGECYTGAIMTVPPVLPPGTLRCSAFWVGIDRGGGHSLFIRCVCDPRIQVSLPESQAMSNGLHAVRRCCSRSALCTPLPFAGAACLTDGPVDP